MKANIKFLSGIDYNGSVEILLGNVYKGDKGMSAYEVAVENGFEGTEEEWLASLHVTTDSELSSTSDNAIANKTVTKEINNINANTGISEYETFSNQKAYSAGDTVLYNGLLYTFTTDHAIGAWDESQVESASLVQQLAQYYLTYKLNDAVLVDFTLKAGYYWNYQYYESDTWNSTEKIPVSAGELYFVYGNGGENGRLLWFYDINDNLKYKSNAKVVVDAILVKESGYLICNSGETVMRILRIQDTAILQQVINYTNNACISNSIDFTTTDIDSAIKKLDLYVSDTFASNIYSLKFASIGYFDTTKRAIIQFLYYTKDDIETKKALTFVCYDNIDDINDIPAGMRAYKFKTNESACIAIVDMHAIGNHKTYDLGVHPIIGINDIDFVRINEITSGVNKLTTNVDNINSEIYHQKKYTVSDLQSGAYYYVGNKQIGDYVGEPISYEPATEWGCIRISVRKGQALTISGKGGSNGRLYTVTDKYKKILAISEANLDTLSNPVVINIEQDGYVFVNQHDAVNPDFYIIINESVIQNLSNDLDKCAKYNDGEVQLDDYNPCKYLIQNMSLFSCIHNWGFIGDSYGAGEFEYIKDSITNYEDNQETYSFGAVLMKMNNVDGYVFASGGMTAKGWCQGSSERTWGGAQKPENLQQAYLIQLGSNDAGNSAIVIGNADTDIDMSDYNNNTDTFAGWYSGIIQRIKSVQPRAICFCATVRYTNDSERRLQMSEVIRNIVTKFSNVFLVDIEKYGIKWDSEFGQLLKNGGHPSAIGHYYQAVYYNTYIDWIIRNNMSAFKEVQFIGTDKTRE